MMEEWLKFGACLSLTPDLVAVGWGKRHWLKSRRSEGPSFYSPDFFLAESTPWFYHDHQAVMTKTELRKQLKDVLPGEPPLWTSLPRALFEESFDALQPLLQQGKLKKAVLYAGQQAPFSFDISRMQASMKALLDRLSESAMHLYGWWGEEQGIMGLTPEILFQTAPGGIVKTMACAGTQETQLSLQAMLTDRKLQEEQQCVSDGIVASLSPFGRVKVGERTARDFGRLRHFVTPIELKVNEQLDFEELVAALHPTPAVGAAPQKAGETWLRAYQQKVPRGRYGAPFGYWDPAQQSALCCVAIRNVQWENHQQEILAGCGILASSQKEQEWNELVLKLNAIKTSLI